MHRAMRVIALTLGLAFTAPVRAAQPWEVTVVNETTEQIVARIAEYEPGPFIVSDVEYIKRQGGAKQDPSVMHGLPNWLEESIIPVKEIEEFKKELAKMGAR